MTDMPIRDVLMTSSRRWMRMRGVWGLVAQPDVRRRLAQDAAVPRAPLGVEDLARFAEAFRLADPDVMTQAWQ